MKRWQLTSIGMAISLIGFSIIVTSGDRLQILIAGSILSLVILAILLVCLFTNHKPNDVIF